MSYTIHKIENIHTSKMEKQGEFKLSYCKKEREKHILDENLTTIADCLKRNAALTPDRDAVVFVSGDGLRIAVSFKEVYDKSRHFANSLIAIGVKQSEYVAISLRTCPEWLFVFFGVMFARARPINIAFTYQDGSDVVAMVEKLRTCAAIVLDPGENDETWNLFKGLVTNFEGSGYVESDKLSYMRYLICSQPPKNEHKLLTLSDLMISEHVSTELPDILPDDVFALFQTSGSTGTPKAVVHSHRSFIPAAVSWVDALWMDADSIYFNDRPFGWGGGFPSTVITGQTRVTRLETSCSPEDYVSWVFETIKKERCTHMYALPLSFHNLLERQGEIGPDWPLRALITGGQPIAKDKAACIGKLCKVFGNLYGSVEQWLTCCSMVENIDDYVEYSIGRPLEGTEMKIVDDNEDVVPVNEKGELYVRDDRMFIGYCNDPVQTKSRFSEDGWYKTDDIGYMTETGIFFCTGRKSDIILSGGLNVTPSILEAILANCPGVARVACVPVSHAVMFQVVCACVILRDGCDVTEETLRDYCVEMHTDKPRLFTVLPAYYLFFEKFPETFSGKVSKKDLTKIAEDKYGSPIKS